MRYRIGVDIGGTFTDCVVITDAGSIYTFKELSTPEDQSIGLYHVVEKALFFKKIGKPSFHGFPILIGGNMWESNPPKQLFTTSTGFEDQRAHQHPSTPIDISLIEYDYIISRNRCTTA